MFLGSARLALTEARRALRETVRGWALTEAQRAQREIFKGGVLTEARRARGKTFYRVPL